MSRVARRRSARLAFVLLLVGIAGCASPKVYRDGTPTIAGRAGDQFVVELASDPATGSSWTLSGQPDPTIVTLMESDFAASPSTFGTAGHQRWTFRLVAPGTSTIIFSYGRTWENAPAQNATMFTITVR